MIKMRITNKIVAVVLTICLLMSLMPYQALATYVADGTEEEGAPSVDMVSTGWGDIPSNFQGHIAKMTYDSSNKLIYINVGLFNIVKPSAGYFSNWTYDTAKVKLLNGDGTSAGRNPEVDKVFKSAPVEKFLLNSTYSDTEKNEILADNPIIIGKGGPLNMTSQTSTISTTEGKLEAIVTLKVASELTSGSYPLSVDFKDILTNENKDVILPNNQLVPLYTLCFRLEDGVEISNIDDTTFGYYTSPSITEAQQGARSADSTTALTSVGYFKMGFPEAPAAQYDVGVSVYKFDGSTPLGNAIVTISKSDKTLIGTYKTNSGGLLVAYDTEAGTTSGSALTTIALEAGDYTYSVAPDSADGTQAANTGSFKVTESAGQTFALKAAEYTAPTYTFDVTVLDGDQANAALAGASVNVDAVPQTTTDNGTVSFTKAENQNPYSLSVSKDGYVTSNGTVKVTPNTGEIAVTGQDISVAQATAEPQANAKVTVTVYKKQKQITLPVVDESNATIANAVVKIVANPAGTVPDTIKDQLPKTFTSNEVGNALLNLPPGDYLFTVQAAGYESTQPIVLTITNNNVIVGGQLAGGTVTGGTSTNLDGSDTATVALPEADRLTAVTGALYSVEGVWDNEDNPTEMTVTVSLQNAKAVMGTFGLRYDSNIFTLTEANAVKEKSILYSTNVPVDGVANPLLNDVYGYHLFVWSGMTDGDNMVTPVDATASAVPLIKYTLKVKEDAKGKIDQLINNESLFVAPLSQTEYQTALEQLYPSSNPANSGVVAEILSEYWRPVDEQNQPDGEGNLTPGRLDASMALAGGFYQIFPVNNDGVRLNNQDVRTQIVFPGSNANIRVEYLVKDESTKLPIPNAEVTIYDKNGYNGGNGTVVKTLQTDDRGIAYTSLPSNSGNYEFFVKKVGYWPLPGSTVEADENKTTTLTANNATVSFNSLLMKAKTYHPVDIALLDDSAQPIEGQNKVVISGEKTAYNDLSYSFHITAKPGYQWKDAYALPGSKPALDAVIKGGGSDNGDINVKATFDAKTNKYVIKGSDITGTPLGITEDDPNTPLDERLKAGDIVIKVNDAYFEQTRNVIVATAGEGGSVSSQPAAGDDIVASGQTITQTLQAGVIESATFTFTPDQSKAGENETAVIDKVIINGIVLENAKGLDQYTYQFVNVASDQSITVTFGLKNQETGDITPISAPVVSVIGSEFGAIKVPDASSPTATVGGGQRQDFILTAKGSSYVDFNAAIVAESGYEVDKVVVNNTILTADDNAKTIDGAQVTYTAAGVLTISGAQTSHHYTLVATFKPEGQASIQAIVTSQVEKGSGTISPLGVAVYDLQATPEYIFIPDDATYQVGDIKTNGQVVHSGIEVGADNVAIYTLPPLSGDTMVLGNFAEVTRKVQMVIQFNKSGNITPYGKATVNFVRKDGLRIKKETEKPRSNQVSLEMDIPKGEWTVTVSKNNFLNYVVTGFQVDTSASMEPIKFGEMTVQETIDGTPTGVVKERPIILTIGDANRDGRLISLSDVAQVANAMTATASNAAKAWGDVDENQYISDTESSKASTTDMSYVKDNYLSRFTNQTYEDFKKGDI